MTTSLRTSDLHGAESRGAPLDARRYLEACGILLAVALLVMASSAMGFPISPARPIRGDPIQCGDSPPGLDLQVTFSGSRIDEQAKLRIQLLRGCEDITMSKGQDSQAQSPRG